MRTFMRLAATLALVATAAVTAGSAYAQNALTDIRSRGKVGSPARQRGAARNPI